jgi:hypothetical protein
MTGISRSRLLPSRVVTATLASGLALALAGESATAVGEPARAAPTAQVIYACVNLSTLALRLYVPEYPDTACDPNAEVMISWDLQGPQGPVGPQGPRGPQGPPGIPKSNATTVIQDYQLPCDNVWRQVIPAAGSLALMTDAGNVLLTGNIIVNPRSRVGSNASPDLSVRFTVDGQPITEYVVRFNAPGFGVVTGMYSLPVSAGTHTFTVQALCMPWDSDLSYFTKISRPTLAVSGVGA